jgi:hypothetical protein
MATIYIRDFPDKLHKEIKLKAVTDETTLKAIVIQAVTEYLKKKDK